MKAKNKSSSPEFKTGKHVTGKKLTSWHVQMKISSAEDLTNKQLSVMFGANPQEIRAELKRLKELGLVFLHTEGCDRQGTKGECLGHTE